MKPLIQKYAITLMALLTIWYVKTNAQRSEFYGMSPKDGKYNNGTIFKTDGNGNYLQVISDFSVTHQGACPNKELCEANNGKLYGMTEWGGAYDYGVIFEWDPVTNSYVKKLDFNGIENGQWPVSSLVRANNGRLYGTTSVGGANDDGVLFEWDPVSNSYSKMLDFDNVEKGRYPNSLMQTGNGKLFGMTVRGGVNDAGVIYEWDFTTGTYTKILDFSGPENGRYPSGFLIQADNGELYGMTSMGGVTEGAYNLGYGTLFKLNPDSNAFTKILDFNGVENGRYPLGSLVQADNGEIFGMTSAGGLYDYGVLFELNPATNAFNKIIDFNGAENGCNPNGSLVKITNGKLIGMTSKGGVNNCGILFEFDPALNTYYKKIDFITDNGCYPNGSLLQSGTTGKFYGMSRQEGIDYITGFLFEWDSSTNRYTKIFEFNSVENGRYPSGSLVLASNGKLYGMTHEGGEKNRGVIFELDPNTGINTKRFDFNLVENGKWPYGSLVQADNGKLYGMTNAGGGTNPNNSDYGVLFEWDPATDIYVKKLGFNGAENGRFPYGSLVKANNGKLYGLTSDGGVYTHIIHSLEFGNGVLFEWDPETDIYTKKLDFNEIENGRTPYGSLIQANNGKLYGVTLKGGAYGYGVLFEWDIVTDSFIKKFDFNGAENGSYPFGDGTLIQANNGKLYGVTQSGGAYDGGVFFEFDPVSNIYIKKFDFNGEENGNGPCGSLVQGDNGKIYGTTARGGANNEGIIFEWDPVKEIFIKKFDFPVKENESFSQSAMIQQDFVKPTDIMDTEGTMSYKGRSLLDPAFTTYSLKSNTSETEELYFNGGLIKIKYPDEVTINAKTCDSYASPSGNHVWTTSGTYKDTIPNATGSDSIITIQLKVAHSNAGTISATSCNKYTSPSGNFTWRKSGKYSDIIPNAAGCDSVITVDLVIVTVDTVVFTDGQILMANAFNASYQWIACHNDYAALEGETDQTFTASEEGSYAVIVTENGCTDTSACYTVKITGMPESTGKNKIVLYPNPTTGSFIIDLGRICTSPLVMISAPDGRTIFEETFYNARIIPVILDSPPGIFIVTICNEEEWKVFKVIKNCNFCYMNH